MDWVQQWLLAALLSSLAWAEEEEEELGSGEERDIPPSVTDYLSRFGYLGKGSGGGGGGVGALRRESSVRDAIRRLQSFAGIPATGLVDPATKDLLARKRCGLPDFPEFKEPDHRPRRLRRWIKQGAVWDHTNLTFRVESWTQDLGPGRVRRIMHESLRLWSDVSALSFTETNAPNADIKISFVRRNHGDGYAFDGPNVVLAHAFFPGREIGGDAHFDDDEEWTDQPIRGYSQKVNLYSVAAHEFGHSLGLSHSAEPSSLMYPYYRHTLRATKLPCDDTEGIQALYGSGGNPAPSGAECAKERQTTTMRPRIEPSSRPTTEAPPTTTAKGPPLPCASHIDAVARIRNEVFVFKGPYFWRFDRKGYLVEQPTLITRFFRGFPENLTRIDAVFERRREKGDEIVFFSGPLFWVFQATKVKRGYPQPLTNLRLPKTLQRVNAAFVWAYNEKTYLFAGSDYWRLDSESGKVLVDYPRRISVWKGVPHAPDAVLTDHEGDTFFFKGDNVYRFNDFFMAVDRHSPKYVKNFWSHCYRQEQIRIPSVSAGSIPSPSLSLPCLSISLLTLVSLFLL